MMPARADPVVHIELHTGDLDQACAFYGGLFGWQVERIGPYTGIGPGRSAVECPTPRPLWLPYVEVADIRAASGRATDLGARVLLPPREGPTGWRSVVSTGAGGEIALWQQKR